MIALIGSMAMKHWGLLHRVPGDMDVVGTYDEFIATCHESDVVASYPINDGKKWVLKFRYLTPIEAELAWPGSLAEELNAMIVDEGHKVLWGPEEFAVADLDILYMLKMSHRYLKNSPHFKKTMDDIWWLRQRGAQIRPEHMDFYQRRMKATYDYPHPKLDQDKAGFFSGDGVNYIFDHDSIHRSVALDGEPMYQRYQKDGAEVSCDRDKFEDLPRFKRMFGVLEEAYVLALERSQIPHPGVWTPRKSFDYALMKVCTSITSGWFREFAWESYNDSIKMYNDNYVTKFWKDVDSGLVIRL